MCKGAECKIEAESANSSSVYWLLWVTLCVYLSNSVADYRDLKQGTSKHVVNRGWYGCLAEEQKQWVDEKK